MRTFGAAFCTFLGAGAWASVAVLLLLVWLWPGAATANRARARALTSEGQVLAEAGQVELALQRYEEAIGSDPDYYTSYELAIPIWMRLGKLKRARSRLETLTLRCRSCAFAWYALGALYRKSGRFDLAVLAYDIYLAKRPDDPDAYFGLAMALGARKDIRAAAMLRRYLDLEQRPRRAAYRQQARRLLEALQDPEADALRALRSSPPSRTLARLNRLAAEAAADRRVLELAGYRALLWAWR